MQKILTKDFKNQLLKEGVILVYLYGSEARGDAKLESDVDIAVLLNNKIKKNTYLKKTLKLSSLFNIIYPSKEIGILILNQAPPLLKQNAIVEGKELFVNDKMGKILFENKALHEYEDSRRLRKIYNEFLDHRINLL